MQHTTVRVVLVFILTALAVPSIRADVKTREKTVVKLEGMMGMSRMMGASASKDGVTSAVAIKGSRKASMNDTTGEIIDLAAERVYRIDMKKKEYKVLTFDQIRQEWKDAAAEAEKNAEKLRDAQKEEAEKPDVNMEFKADVKETDQRKSIAGHETREVIVTITGKEVGKTLEEGGGMVTTMTMWLAAPIAAIDEVHQFELKYMKAIVGDDAAAQVQQQLAAMFALFPSLQTMMGEMRKESSKLRGTPLQTTTVAERVKSAEQMKAGSASSSGGGGLGGLMAGRMMGGRGSSSGPRSTVMTTSSEFLSIETAVTEADVAVPPGFKEKK